MRGSLKQRYEGSWSLILDLGYHTDPITALRKRRQKWITFRGTKKDAQTKLTELLNAQNKGVFIEPTKRTFGEWLAEWLDKAIKPPYKTPRTYDTYKGVIGNHLVPKLGAIRLQELKSIDLDHYYAEQAATLAPGTLEQHHMILHGSLEQAVREGLVV